MTTFTSTDSTNSPGSVESSGASRNLTKSLQVGGAELSSLSGNCTISGDDYELPNCNLTPELGTNQSIVDNALGLVKQADSNLATQLGANNFDFLTGAEGALVAGTNAQATQDGGDLSTSDTELGMNEANALLQQTNQAEKATAAPGSYDSHHGKIATVDAGLTTLTDEIAGDGSNNAEASTVQQDLNSITKQENTWIKQNGGHLTNSEEFALLEDENVASGLLSQGGFSGTIAS